MADDLGEHPGLGLIPSPPSEADYELAALIEAGGGPDLASWVAPSSFDAFAAVNPPVLNQGTTPQCVSYSHSALKAYQDRKDQGKFFDFNESYFFSLIGGTSAGAVIKNALDRLRSYGYPVVTIGDAAHHKIAAYYAVSKLLSELKYAVYHYGPVVMGMHWYHSWFHPYSNGLLPPPDYVYGGHAILIRGWNDSLGAFRLRNSWGSGWGLGGDCYIPYSYVLGSSAFEFWKTTDVIDVNTATVSPVSKYASPRVAGVPAGHTVYGWSASSPNKPVVKYTAPYDRGSSFRVDGKQTVTWSPIIGTVPHGTFLHGDPVNGGVFKNLLVVPSSVIAADGKPW